MIRVTLYTRSRCCLCDQAKQVLEAARLHAAFEIEEIDIDRHPQFRALYNDDVPVIAINGREAFRHRMNTEAFLKRLAEDA